MMMHPPGYGQGQLTQLARQYRAGDITFAQLTDAFVAFKLKPLGTYDCPPGDMACIDEHLFDDPTDTVDEVKDLVYHNLLTEEELDALWAVKAPGY